MFSRLIIGGIIDSSFILCIPCSGLEYILHLICQRGSRASGIDMTSRLLYGQVIQKGYAYAAYSTRVYRPETGSVRHTFHVPGTGAFPWDKIRGRGWNTATALIVGALVRTSAKQMSHRSRVRPGRAALLKIVSLG